MQKERMLQAALALACTMVAVLALRMHQLRADYTRSLEAQTHPAIGTWVPEVGATLSDGHEITVGRADQELQLLYFFDRGCPSCKASVPAMQQVQQVIAREHLPVGVVGLTHKPAAGVSDYLRTNRLAFPVTALTPRLHALFGVHVVPLIIAVDRESRVRYSHAGALDTTEKVQSLLTALRATERHAGVPLD